MTFSESLTRSEDVKKLKTISDEFKEILRDARGELNDDDINCFIKLNSYITQFSNVTESDKDSRERLFKESSQMLKSMKLPSDDSGNLAKEHQRLSDVLNTFHKAHGPSETTSPEKAYENRMARLSRSKK